MPTAPDALVEIWPTKKGIGQIVMLVMSMLNIVGAARLRINFGMGSVICGTAPRCGRHLP